MKKTLDNENPTLNIYGIETGYDVIRKNRRSRYLGMITRIPKLEGFTIVGAKRTIPKSPNYSNIKTRTMNHVLRGK